MRSCNSKAWCSGTGSESILCAFCACLLALLCFLTAQAILPPTSTLPATFSLQSPTPTSGGCRSGWFGCGEIGCVGLGGNPHFLITCPINCMIYPNTRFLLGTGTQVYSSRSSSKTWAKQCHERRLQNTLNAYFRTSLDVADTSNIKHHESRHRMSGWALKRSANEASTSCGSLVNSARGQMSCMIAHDFAIFLWNYICIYIPSKNDLDPWHFPLKKLGRLSKKDIREINIEII